MLPDSCAPVVAVHHLPQRWLPPSPHSLLCCLQCNESSSPSHLIWALSKADIRKIDALDQWCLRRILDIRWYHRVSNWEVRRLTEQPLLTSIVQKRRLMLFGHLIRMDESADARRILTAVPRVIGEGQLDDPTPPGWPILKNDIYLCTTSPLRMLSKWPWISRCGDNWRQAELRTDGACQIMMMMMMISSHHSTSTTNWSLRQKTAIKNPKIVFMARCAQAFSKIAKKMRAMRKKLHGLRYLSEFCLNVVATFLNTGCCRPVYVCFYAVCNAHCTLSSFVTVPSLGLF